MDGQVCVVRDESLENLVVKSMSDGTREDCQIRSSVWSAGAVAAAAWGFACKLKQLTVSSDDSQRDPRETIPLPGT